MGYTPIFSGVFDGTLHGKYPDSLAWIAFLALADKNGVVDMTPEAISSRTGMPLDVLLSCISRFEQPDPRSRSSDHDGRRLIRVDPDRDWGWRIVNHSKYREKARLLAKSEREVAEGKNAERMRDRRRPPETAADPLSNSNTNKEYIPAAAGPPKRAKSSKRPEVPLPEDFTVDAELEAYAKRYLPDVNVSALAEVFISRAKTKQWRYADWRQAFQTYVRNAAPDSGHWASGQYPRYQWQ